MQTRSVKFYSSVKDCGFFPVYLLDERIAKANDFLHSRTLGQTDRVRFYLWNGLT